MAVDKYKNPSILHQMLVLLRIQIITVMLVILFAAGLTVFSSWEQLKTSGTNLLDIYAAEMNNRMNQAWQNLASVVYDNYDLDLLESGTEQDRYHASIRLVSNMENVLKTSSSVQMMVIADAAYDICLDVTDGTFSLDEKEFLREFGLKCARGEAGNTGWQFLDGEKNTYLYRMLQNGRRVSLVIIKTDSLMSGIKDSHAGRMAFVLTDKEGAIHASAGEDILGQSEQNIRDINIRRYYTGYTILADGQVGFVYLQKRTDVFRQMKAGGVLLVGAALLLLMFDYYIYRLLKRRLVLPMKESVEIMERISEGNTDLRLPAKGETLEFITLTDTFNHLMDEIVSLKIQSYEKQLALSDAEQKYIRLQIRPHFFLNAMTTIGSLSSTGRTEEIQTYIDALSVNIRYMFTSGLHTVPVREEISHVENYFTMQELKYPDAVFYYVDMPEDLGDWPIPQMLIHTLIENEYKYAIPQEGTLTILMRVYEENMNEDIEEEIRTDIQEMREGASEGSPTIIQKPAPKSSGGRMLVIEIEDDGKGYPQEVIDSIMNGSAEASEDGSRVGLYSIKRLLYLMYDREDLFMIGNIKPHGAFNRIRIPEKVVHERKRQE